MSVDWMPIETAPHDTRVLVYGEYDGIVVGVYSSILKEWCMAESHEVNTLEPTEWQPLPPPPALKK